MGVTIARESPDTETARSLIAELAAALDHPDYPPESRHGYSVDTLIRAGVHFFVMRLEGEAAGCGGIQFFSDFGELKRMYVRGGFRGRGLGQALLRHLRRPCPCAGLLAPAAGDGYSSDRSHRALRAGRIRADSTISALQTRPCEPIFREAAGTVTAPAYSP